MFQVWTNNVIPRWKKEWKINLLVSVPAILIFIFSWLIYSKVIILDLPDGATKMMALISSLGVISVIFIFILKTIRFVPKKEDISRQQRRLNERKK